MRDGHACVGTDVSPEAVGALADEGMTGGGLAGGARRRARAAAGGVGDGPGRRDHRAGGRPSSATLLEPGDTIIDGGNTRYHDDIRRARELAERGIHYVDVGTSGGVFGLERGFCLMVGGEDEVVDAARAALHLARAGPRRRRAHPGPSRRPGARGARLAPLRAGGRRALREDGAQRHRVRADGRLRRRPERPPPRERRRAPRASRTPRPRRSTSRSTTATTSTSPRSPRCGGAGAWWRRGCST